MDQVTLEIMNPIEIGRRIRQARNAKGLTQKALGKLAGVSESAVSQWESGKIEKIQGPTLRKLARALGVSIDWILDGEGAPDMIQDDRPGGQDWDYLTEAQRIEFVEQIRKAAEHNRALLEQFGVKKFDD
jgi:transcriptional regulator with XRE-family HTH domain